MRLYAILTACVLGLGPLPALAQDDPVQSTIQSQFDAFLRDDFAGAFAYASPTIKGIFGTPETFGRMVREGYPMVHRPAGIKMLERRYIAGALWQKVLVTDMQGQTHVLDYQMIDTPEGWQINGVQILPNTSVGV